VTAHAWIAVTLKVIEVLDALGVKYVICGSAASIVHGVVRSTIDTDLIADLHSAHVQPLVTALEEEFYIDAQSISGAIATRGSFNLIHQNSMFKVDVFIPKPRPFDQAQLAHRIETVICHNPDRTAWIVSAEDIVLAKLEWFRLGDEVSERQWRDVLGVLKIQTGKLDIGYMQATARQLGVSDLLELALKEAAK